MLRGPAGFLSVVAALVFAVAAAACGGSGHAPPPLAPADARSVSELSRAYARTYATVVVRVENRLNHEFDFCPLTRSDPNGAPGRPGEQQFVVLQQAAILQAILPYYRTFARNVGRVNRGATQLQAASRAMSVVATSYRGVRNADTHYCSILRKWAAQHWAPRFSVAKAMGASILAKRPTPRVAAAYSTLTRTALALRGAGGEPRNINLFLRFTHMFLTPSA